MRLFVILAAVSAVIAMPLPQSDLPENQQESQPEAKERLPPGAETTWDSLPVPAPLPPPTNDGTIFDDDTPWWVRAGRPDPSAFQKIDPAEITGNVLNGAWDTNAKVVDTIGKVTGLGALGTGAAGLWNVITGGGGVVPTLPDVPNVPNVGAYSGS
ncbi:hypothetical protein MMC22_000545 [Lobaria immixta]|nr:hypothetical protein [Lobaria immixta]